MWSLQRKPAKRSGVFSRHNAQHPRSLERSRSCETCRTASLGRLLCVRVHRGERLTGITHLREVSCSSCRRLSTYPSRSTGKQDAYSGRQAAVDPLSRGGETPDNRLEGRHACVHPLPITPPHATPRAVLDATTPVHLPGTFSRSRHNPALVTSRHGMCPSAGDPLDRGSPLGWRLKLPGSNGNLSRRRDWHACCNASSSNERESLTNSTNKKGSVNHANSFPKQRYRRPAQLFSPR